jgi:uncharacterized protein
MAKNYKTPGVYAEEILKYPPSVAPVDTAVPAFVGYTEKAADKVSDDLFLKPRRISSMVEYEKYFGGADPETRITVILEESDTTEGKEIKAHAELCEADRSAHIMYYALQMFYANGGGVCYIVSVGKYNSISYEDLREGLDVIQSEDEPTLILFPEAQSLKIAEFAALHNGALAQCELLKDRFVIMDLHPGSVGSMNDPGLILSDAVDEFRTDGIGNENLKYGAVYAPNIETNIAFVFDELTTKVIHSINGIISGPVPMDSLKGVEEEMYERANSAIADLSCKLPPSSAVAGVYAKTDSNRGVWKAPANVSLNAVVSPTIPISNTLQAKLNIDTTSGKSFNTIREFAGKGTLVYGSRTLAGNDNEWRYINVRRFFNFVEESLKKATYQFVFEPNDANTWVKVKAMIENFLTALWRQGALQGVKPEHAFYVSVGLGRSMTPQDILEGRMIIEIGMAAVRPAEFIIIRFSKKMAES